jgi:hypothetical protein
MVPRLFKGLILRVFDDNGVLRDCPDVQAIRYLRQLYYAAKKVSITCDDSRTWKTVHEFFETDRKIRSPTLDWDGDEFRLEHLQYCHLGNTGDVHPAPLFGDNISSFTDIEGSFDRPGFDAFDAAQGVADIVVAALGGFDPAVWRTKHGPGAVADQRHTSFKYDFPNWPDKLDRVFPLDEHGFANASEWANFANGDGSYGVYSPHEPPSRLIAVPKTQKGPRLIAAEPVAHQWCQQAIKDFLTIRLSSTPIAGAIHFQDQTYNQEMAREASHTQSHMTIDLSSASDRLSCWVVERVFRRSPSLITAFHACRTRWVENSIDRKSPQFHKLRKFSCMGSACTFPVQSIVFTVLAISALLNKRGMPINLASVRWAAKEVQVFGDDIIVPVDCGDLLQGLLGHLGLKVNPHKTFGKGKFRESCGLDAYDGHDVTPTYSMTYPEVSRPESIMSQVATHNNFAMRCYWRAAEFIQSRIRMSGLKDLALVPIGSGAFGLYDFKFAGNGHLQRRWNAQLQRVEYRTQMPISKSERLQPKSDSLLLQYFTVARTPIQFLLGERLGVAKRPTNSIRRRWVEASQLS